ncbi:MAG: hypothetical protein SVY53_00040 [Chloroflexota bacterium]|nr:hypothetical protein [Chloroflexota bacterium]
MSRFAVILIMILSCLLISSLLAPLALADWKEGDSYKMHFPQLPDEDGWDVNATWPNILADDWRCTETGWIKDIHFWGSWRDGIPGDIEFFHLSIHNNIPAGTINYSTPGTELWTYDVPINQVEVIGPIQATQLEGWYDPPEVSAKDQSEYFQYNVILPEDLWFLQQEGEIYWLDISARVVPDPTGVDRLWGWKTADTSSYPDLNSHFMDDAVIDSMVNPRGWEELIDPYTDESLDLAFVVTPELPAVALFSVGVVGVLGYFGFRRFRRRSMMS